MIRLIKITDVDNVYGDDIIDILQFNFDGDGSALVRYINNNEEELDFLPKQDLMNVMGLAIDEHPKCYKFTVIKGGSQQ